MNDKYKTKSQLITELEQLRGRLAELEHAEKMLAFHEERYERLFESSPIGITTLDLKGVITSCNSAVARAGGYSTEELIGKHFSKIGLLKAKDLPKYRKLFASIIKGEAIKPLEVTFKRKDGSIGYCEVYVALLQVGGRTLGIQVLERDLSARKRIEKEMGESEEKFKSLAEQSPNMIFVNKKGRVVYVNQKCEEIMGYKKEEFYSPDFNFLSLFAPESLEIIKAKYSEHLQGSEVSPYEYTLITKKGQRIEAINVPKLIHYQGDQAILGVVTDITERKRIEQSLQESEELYRSLIERANDGIAIIQDDMRIMFVNDRMAEMMRYKVEELIDKKFQDFIPAEYLAELTNRYKQRMAGTPLPSIYETCLQKKNGEKINVEINAGIINYKGKPADLVFIRNITERKRAEETIAESERLYRELVEAASDVVYTTGPDGCFTYINPTAKKLTGYSEDQLKGMHFTELISPDWKDRVEQFYKLQRDDQVHNSTMEFPIITHTGKRKWVEQKVTMTFKDGKFTGAQSIVRDITERKRTEQNLQEMASIDSLTSLFNRRRFSEFLKHEIDRTKRYNTELSIIMLDIDHFKKINDTYGHQQGDNVLRLLALRVKDIIRESDIVARWGGEEFMVIAANTDEQNAKIIAEKIRADIEKQRYKDITGVTVSAGVTQFRPDDDASSVVERVDEALYAAKNNGRNQVRTA